MGNDEKKEKNLKNVKKTIPSALVRSPGRWTGNIIIFKDGLRLCFIDGFFKAVSPSPHLLG